MKPPSLDEYDRTRRKQESKAKLLLIARSKLKTPEAEDFPCYSVEEDWHDPPINSHCWFFDWNYHWVGKGTILEKIDGNRDREDTWRVLITFMMEDGPSYYVRLTETFLRSQIWPTRKECYTALYGHIEQEIMGKEHDIDELKARRNEVEVFMPH